MLTPGKDKWQSGDEFLYTAMHGDEESFHWRHIAAKEYWGEVIDRSEIVRRPVPEHVRRSMAWHALFVNLTVPHPENRIVFRKHGNYETLIWALLGTVYFDRGFKTHEEWEAAIPILGGEAEIIKNLQEGPGAYMRWVLGV